jgi:hypothetical protein
MEVPLFSALICFYWTPFFEILISGNGVLFDIAVFLIPISDLAANFLAINAEIPLFEYGTDIGE